MLKKYWNTFVECSFSPWGIAAWGAIGGVVMTFLTYLTTALKDYAPLSYGVAAAFGIMAIIAIFRGALSVWMAFNQRVFTKKPTFIEYKVENGKIGLVDHSNIYQEPTLIFQNNFILQQQENLTAPINRKAKRTQNALANTQPLPAIKKPSSARIIAIFEKPISSSSMLTKLEIKHGNSPSLQGHSISERWASVAVSNISDSCVFRIWFNKHDEEK